MSAIALPKRLPTQGSVLTMIVRPRASYVVFRETDYGLAAFVMSMLQMMSPECQLVVEEWGCGQLRPTSATRRAPPLAMLVIAFCGRQRDIRSALTATLEKAINTTADFERSNPADRVTWKGVTLQLIWELAHTQAPHFTMSYSDFVSITTQQRADVIMTALSPLEMRKQPLLFYNLGTADVHLLPRDYPMSFGDDISVATKMDSVIYGIIPSTSAVHQNWRKILRPSIMTSSLDRCTAVDIACMLSNDPAVALLAAAYTQIYDISDDVLSHNQKHQLCISITFRECTGVGCGMNPNVATFLRDKNRIFKSIDESSVCRRLVGQWKDCFAAEDNQGMFFVRMTELALQATGLTVNVRPIAGIIAICISGTLALPFNRRNLNIVLCGPPGTGKTFILDLLGGFAGHLVRTMQSETPTAMLCGDPLLDIPYMSVADGTWGIYVNNDQPPAKANKDGGLQELKQSLSYDGVAGRKTADTKDGVRKAITSTVVGSAVNVASTNWPITNSAQNDRTCKINIGPGGMMVQAPACVGHPSKHAAWSDICTVYSAMSLVVATGVMTSIALLPNVSPATGWVWRIFDLLSLDGSQRSVERVERVAASLSAHEQGMHHVIRNLSGEATMEKDQLIMASTTCPLNEQVVAYSICMMTPTLRDISDIYIPVLCGLSSYLDTEFQVQPGTYRVAGYTQITTFERSVLAGLQAQNNIKLEKTSACPVADILMRAGVMALDTSSDPPAINVSIAAVSCVIPRRDRVVAVKTLLGRIKENLHLFTHANLVSTNRETVTHTKCVVLPRGFVRWLSNDTVQTISPFMRVSSNRTSECYAFLDSVKHLRGSCMWSELVNGGMIPTPPSESPHKIDGVWAHPRPNNRQPDDGVGAKQQQPDDGVGAKGSNGKHQLDGGGGGTDHAGNILLSNSKLAPHEFLLPVDSINVPRLNVPDIVERMRSVPRIGKIVVPAYNGVEMPLDVTASLRGLEPIRVPGREVCLLDGNMDNTMFPSNTDAKLVMAATMATTIAAKAYHMLDRITNVMINGTTICAFTADEWVLPPLEEDLRCNNISVVTMCARAMALLMCAFDRKLVSLGDRGELLGSCKLFVVIANMLRSACPERLVHAWTFIENAPVTGISCDTIKRLVRNMPDFIRLVDVRDSIGAERVSRWMDRHAYSDAWHAVDFSNL